MGYETVVLDEVPVTSAERSSGDLVVQVGSSEKVKNVLD